MIYISNYHSFENYYYNQRKHLSLKKNKVNAAVPKHGAVEGGVVLILSNPFENDGLRRIYVRLIDRVREDNEADTIRVDLFQYYILKEQQDGKILPELIEPLTPMKRKSILNMDNNGIYLNENKTPLWQISCTMNKVSFFGRYQPLLKTLTDNYKDVIIPKTQSKQPPNLH